MTENNKKQALVVEGSIVLENKHGMAPGMIIEDGDHIYILLPGPPSEMQPIFLESVQPFLLPNNNQQNRFTCFKIFWYWRICIRNRNY